MTKTRRNIRDGALLQMQLPAGARWGSPYIQIRRGSNGLVPWVMYPYAEGIAYNLHDDPALQLRYLLDLILPNQHVVLTLGSYHGDAELSIMRWQDEAFKNKRGARLLNACGNRVPLQGPTTLVAHGQYQDLQELAFCTLMLTHP